MTRKLRSFKGCEKARQEVFIFKKLMRYHVALLTCLEIRLTEVDQNRVITIK